jgi:hypothetical protein
VIAAAEPLSFEDRPHLEIVAASSLEPEPEVEETIEASPLSMARVTAELQLLLAARRAERFGR